MRSELDKGFGFTHKMMYPDYPGFASFGRSIPPLRLFTSSARTRSAVDRRQMARDFAWVLSEGRHSTPPRLRARGFGDRRSLVIGGPVDVRRSQPGPAVNLLAASPAVTPSA